MKLLLHWLILTVAVLAAAYTIPGIQVATFLTALIVAAVLGFINTIIKPIIKILTLPINILTLGIFSLVLNGFFFWLVARVIDGFSVATFMAAFWGALIVSIINWFGGRFLKEE
jgi:putative membrane protein